MTARVQYSRRRLAEVEKRARLAEADKIAQHRQKVKAFLRQHRDEDAAIAEAQRLGYGEYSAPMLVKQVAAEILQERAK